MYGRSYGLARRQALTDCSLFQTHLFIHHVLRFHLTRSQTREAVVFASHYQHLVYFAHALEILLHAVLEDEADSLPNSSLHLPPLQTALSISTGPKVPKNAVLPVVVDFLDHFTEALQVVVNCARKTEITRWAYLFQFVGKPRDLFEVCNRHIQVALNLELMMSLAGTHRPACVPASSKSRHPIFWSFITSSL